jgi:hypothetical protein
MCVLCCPDPSMFDWGPVSRRRALTTGSAFLATAALGISGTSPAQAQTRSTPAVRSAEQPRRAPHNTVFANARVIDPESGLDAVRNVGVTRDKIAAISTGRLEGDEIVDAARLVLAPGFIDLHCHAQTIPAMRMAALDGVTTALELELGGLPIPQAYASADIEGRPINFGFSASWAMARQHVMDDAELDGQGGSYFANFGKPRWKELASAEEQLQIVALIERALKDGAIGIGLMLGYAPNSSFAEYVEIARLAKRYDVATFTHARFSNIKEPKTSIEGIEEVISIAAATGAHMHLCHLHSTAGRLLPMATEMFRHAQEAGLRITTEANPWGSASTSIGAAFYAPTNLDRLGLTPADILYVPTKQRLASLGEFEELRKRDPAGIGIFFWLDENKSDDRAILDSAVLYPDAVIATDRFPFFLNGRILREDVWPLPKGAYAHPRGVGSFARILGRYVRERKQLSLSEAIRKSCLLPAQLLERSAPMMRNKGRIKVGADADIVVFDPESIVERATYDDPLQASAGVRHVLVNGVSIVKDGSMQHGALPGRPVRGPLRT